MGKIVDTTTEEYIYVNGELKPVKRKVVRMEVPPDVAAVKMVLNNTSSPLTNEQIEVERQNLLNVLGRAKNENNFISRKNKKG